MRILVWHGWLLAGSGSNVYTARTVEIWRRQGHDVLLVCQEPHPDAYPFIDAWGTAHEPASLRSLSPEPAPGRAVLVRPDIGELLPVFVYDEYEGFRVKTLVDLTDDELDAYLDANVTALRAAAAWHGSELAVAGHALPGPAIVRKALPTLSYVAKVHGSDIEYAMRPQPRYVELAREGLEGAVAVTGSSQDVIDRLVELVPSVTAATRVVSPGVEVERFRPLPRREALLRTAELLDAEPARDRGRTADTSRRVEEALRKRDASALDLLAGDYDQTAPDAEAPAVLRELADGEGPLVGYLGKLIPQKGVHHLLVALALLDPPTSGLIVGFGTFREWLEALSAALHAGDEEDLAFLTNRPSMSLDLDPKRARAGTGFRKRVRFTGRLDHRYAATAVAALDVLVVPSILEEAFGMVALEGAAAGALPLVAQHSGLAEIARVLETEAGEAGLFSYEPGPSAVENLTRGLERLLAIPSTEREDLGRRVSGLVADRWGWEHTAGALLEAAGVQAPG